MTVLGLLISAVLFIVGGFNANITFYKYNWIYCVKAGPDY